MILSTTVAETAEPVLIEHWLKDGIAEGIGTIIALLLLIFLKIKGRELWDKINRR